MDGSPTMSEKARIRPAPEPGIELLQLAALALVAHPHPLERIPHPRPVKQIEDARAILAVGRVERLDRRRARKRARPRRPAAFARAHRGNPSAGQRTDWDRDCRDSGSPGLRAGRRSPAALPSRVGTITMVRWRSGIPLEKSRRGSARGGRTSVTSRFTSETASAEAATRRGSANSQTRQSPGSNAPTTASTPAVASAVSSRMGPRYRGRRTCRLARLTRILHGNRQPTAVPGAAVRDRSGSSRHARCDRGTPDRAAAACASTMAARATTSSLHALPRATSSMT